MSLVVFVGGVPNAGKSTIAAGLAGAIPHTEFIDGDFVFSESEEEAFKDFSLRDQWTKQLEKIVVVINQKVALNRNVAVAWPLLQSGYDYVKSNITDKARIYCVFLNPDLASLGKNRLARPLKESDKERGYDMHAEGYPKQKFWDLVLDTTEMLPFDTVRVITQAIE
ncbi:MAG: hypothetical protein IPI58_05560 [Alphaproteobacteria bacterium]|nr:MAG: hypothetical protein IPI58_05560 [Alphaproteobacteria bacterium]